MSSLEELRAKRAALNEKTDTTIRNMQKITNEAYRVADVAHNSRQHIKDLDREFESATGLQGNDIKFLFAATALQVARIVILNELTKEQTAGNGNRNEDKLHDFQKKIMENFSNGGSIADAPYYCSMEHIISKTGVPYDATAPLSESAIERLMGKGKEWGKGNNLSEMIPTEKLGLFKGANHRFATLGHDPVLGLLFGTGNIMTNTITCVKKLAGIPILTTNHVVYTTEYTDPRIATYGSTAIMLKKAVDRTLEQPSALLASLIKQIIHIGTDLYTPCGIQIPGANLLLTNTNAEKLTKYISTGDIIKVGASMKLAEFINMLISTIHTLMYDDTSKYSRDIYNVRTRKIVTTSNLIATGNNVLWVGGNMLEGNEGAIKQLDIGGLIVLAKRLISDEEYIRQLKEEYVLGGFRKMIQGEELGLEEVKWES